MGVPWGQSDLPMAAARGLRYRGTGPPREDHDRARDVRKTSWIATIGPACDGLDTIKAMIHAGMNVARLNFSHDTHVEHRKRLELVRQAARELGANVAVMLDTKGVKIRTGRLGAAARRGWCTGRPVHALRTGASATRAAPRSPTPSCPTRSMPGLEDPDRRRRDRAPGASRSRPTRSAAGSRAAATSPTARA